MLLELGGKVFVLLFWVVFEMFFICDNGILSFVINLIFNNCFDLINLLSKFDRIRIILEL